MWGAKISGLLENFVSILSEFLKVNNEKSFFSPNLVHAARLTVAAVEPLSRHYNNIFINLGALSNYTRFCLLGLIGHLSRFLGFFFNKPNNTENFQAVTRLITKL